MFGRSKRLNSMPLYRSISSALMHGCEPGTPTSLARTSIHQRLVDEVAQLRAQRVGARRHQLGEELDAHARLEVDEERRARQPAPGDLAGRAEDLRRGWIEHDGEPEPEAHAIVL